MRRHAGLPADSTPHYAAQLLWRRGICDPEQLKGFLNPKHYLPASPFEFGPEMNQAVDRLQKAREQGEKVAIWGDFDADGVTATAVLWQGLGEFFTQQDQLSYFIPNRLTESHGLSICGITQLAELGRQLIVTCDTGSANLQEIEYAQALGIDVIITDHHTLPAERPPVTAIINPRYLKPSHPLAHLSGVAVAYKLVEALYQTFPQSPQRPLEDLLDLVAIGLIADLVQLTGDCRYLAQVGVQRLQRHLSTQKKSKASHRPGVARLLELCKRSGDRPTDISFGLGPRINAVSRIHGDASFCVELLTSQDPLRCRQLAEETELANARRKVLQKDLFRQVSQKLEQIDLSTTQVIVLADTQWPIGVLGLVAGQVSQQYGRPAILLTIDPAPSESGCLDPQFARGSARSVNQIDLYQLVKDQSHLLHSFGGHPFAAGLSLPVENIPLFVEAINRQLREQQMLGETVNQPVIAADLTVKAGELGQALFRELKLLEPCGMGNPTPKLLLQSVWFEKVWNRNIKDWRGGKLSYIKTEFEIWDDSVDDGFPGVWWGHYKDDLPAGRCDVIAEIDVNTYQKRYEIRLLAVRPAAASPIPQRPVSSIDWLVDCRRQEETSATASALAMTQCPASWDDLQPWVTQAAQTQQPLAIAYSPPPSPPPQTVWIQLLGIAKHLARTGKTASYQQIQEKLAIGDRTLQLGFHSLNQFGFNVSDANHRVQIQASLGGDPLISAANAPQALRQFLEAVQEEQFRRQYFYQAPVSTLQEVAGQMVVRLGTLS